jgi:hypothetical protein
MAAAYLNGCAPLIWWPRHRLKGWMLSRSTLPRIQCIWLALVASDILLLCQCYPVSSDIEDLTTMSQPVSFTQFICCNCHDTDAACIATTYFSTRRVELHSSRSKVCKAAGKGVRSVPTVYRESRRAEDQEAGPVGAPGQWLVRTAGGGGVAGEISSPISKKTPQYRKYTISVYCDIAYTSSPISGKRPDIGSTRYRYIAIFAYTSDTTSTLISVYCDIFCDIGAISGTISVKTPISGLATNGCVPILTRYRTRCREKNRYRARFLQYLVWQLTGMSRY